MATKESFWGWTLKEWNEAYASSGLKPRQALARVLADLPPDDPAWIRVVTVAELDRQLDALEKRLEAAGGNTAALPLYGVPFAVKDNIDAGGLPTTAACSAFSFVPDEDAPVVARLKAAGAILMGKTNLDQFATGLVGVRSPYGIVPNPFDPLHVSGGSSSGSASVVARGLVAFGLGTDTAGSGRVPAAFNNLVGLKPTRGALSTRGVFPACRSLDCVSVLALTVGDAVSVARLAGGYDDQDPYSRAEAPCPPPQRPPSRRRFGIPAEPRWFDDALQKSAYGRALERLRALGVELVPVDFSPMHAMADLLYEGPWVAERLAALEGLLTDQPEAVHPVVREIILKGRAFSATDTFKAEYRRVTLARTIHAAFEGLDGLLMPSVPDFPTIEQVLQDPIESNSRLGIYTNFVNLADCCALALPAGFRDDGLPFGITLVAPAWRDQVLAEFGRFWQRSDPWPLGATRRKAPSDTEPGTGTEAPDRVILAVVGAHLRGMPLNHQLTSRDAQFLEETTTAACYKLYALPGTVPPKPGLIRDDQGGEIKVELWSVPLDRFGGFVAEVPPPLGIGTLVLADGRRVKGFICEGIAVAGARDISSYGGWRAFVDELTGPSRPGPSAAGARRHV